MSYSIVPKPFHSPNSLNRGWVSSKTILIILPEVIKLFKLRLVKVLKLFCLELLATLLIAIKPRLPAIITRV